MSRSGALLKLDYSGLDWPRTLASEIWRFARAGAQTDRQLKRMLLDQLEELYEERTRDVAAALIGASRIEQQIAEDQPV